MYKEYNNVIKGEYEEIELSGKFFNCLKQTFLSQNINKVNYWL